MAATSVNARRNTPRSTTWRGCEGWTRAGTGTVQSGAAKLHALGKLDRHQPSRYAHTHAAAKRGRPQGIEGAESLTSPFVPTRGMLA